MRRLNTQDAFKMFRIFKKTDIASKSKKCIEVYNKRAVTQEEIKEKQTELGEQIIYLLFEILSDTKTEECFYDFIAPIFEIEAKGIKEMELPELIKGLKQIVNENDITGFFKLAIPAAQSLRNC